MALFDVLPSDLFKPLASPSRRFYADLLLNLHEKTFSLAAEAPRRTQVIQEIGDFLTRWEFANNETVDRDEEKATALEDRARTIYQRLVDTGWMIEHKDRYIRLVDLDPDASGLLHVLAGIERGDTRTYGGAVIAVLTSLESATTHPADRSENIRNALIGARDFMAHMRMVSVSLRKVEERIVRQDNLRDIFRHFFEDFVQRHLIADFKTLHTKNNPFRFRSTIIHQAQKMLNDPLLLFALGEAYWREGRAQNAHQGELAVSADLGNIIAIFESTEGHLSAIDNTAASIEKRIMTTARYMDRIGRSTEARLIEAMKALSSASGDVDNRLVQPPFLPTFLPIGPAHIPTPRREKPPIEISGLRENKKDPGLELFIAAKADYTKRTRVAPQRLAEFIQKALGDQTSIKGSEIKIVSVDDFVCFQRLREIKSIFDGFIAKKYELEYLDTRLHNEWIECQDFVIKPKKQTKV
jgi:hypothetical protein